MKLLVVVVATQLVEFDESGLIGFSIAALKDHMLADLPSFVADENTVRTIEITEVRSGEKQ